MWLLKRVRSGWERLTAAPALPEEVEAALVLPLYTRSFSLLSAHLTGIAVAGAMALRVGGTWPRIFVAALLVLFAARLSLLYRIGRQRSMSPSHVLRWRGPYQRLGLVWVVASSAMCAFGLVASGDEVIRIVSVALMFGNAAGTASRNAGTPRFTVILLCVWLVPMIALAPALGPWYRFFSLLLALYLVGLCSIVQRYHGDVLAMVRAERHAAALAARFDAALSNMTQGLLLFDAAGVLQVVNRRFLELFGLRSEAVRAGMTTDEFVAGCLAGGAPHDLLPRFGDAPPEQGGRAVLDLAEGRAFARSEEALPDGGRVITLEDVTESRRAQLALAEREGELRTVVENAAAGVTEIDCATGRFVRVNRVFCELVGWSEADLLGEVTRTELTHPDDRPAAREKWIEICETGRPYEMEKRYRRPDGSIVWVRIAASVATVDATGKPRRIVAIVTDVTARKAAEDALRASQEMLRLSLDIGRIGSFRMEHKAGLIHCGSDTRQMHGFPPSDEPLRIEDWASTWSREDRERLTAELAAAYTTQQSVATFEYRFNHPELGVRHIETRARIDYDETGQPNGSVGVAIDVTERREAEARIAHLAHHDGLTDLPNRTLFRIRIEEALARAKRGDGFAVCCLDLDHFKDVNDTLGHPVGDALLQAVTARLRSVVRPTDTVARLGGDEFAIIQASLDQPASARSLAERLVATLAVPFEIEGHGVVIGTSVGIALAPEDGLDADLLLRNADMALYGAKADGRGRYRFFEPEMNHRMQARRALEIDLRQALDAGEFELAYQPLISVSTRTLRGFEALLRWRHPIRGLVVPDRFIPLSEAIGLIVPIGAWVLRTACAEAATWPGSLRVAVNLSAVQFGGDHLVDTVADALRDAGLDPGRLELEITETAMLHDTETTLDTLHRLKALGVTIAMDDFGTGYSSLSYLQRFPFDKVKIDRSFTVNLGRTRESAAIVGAVIDLCAGLDMGTTAEGVEHEHQIAALAQTRCTEAQGYYISPPRPAVELPALIAKLTEPTPALV